MKNIILQKTIFICAAIAALGNFLVMPAFARSEVPLNIVLISIDSARPDHLSCYGYRQKTSPTIDRLAAKGVLFTQAIAQGSYTHSSLPSLISSLYPSSSGIYSWNRKLLPNVENILPRLLKAQGYTTAFVSPHPIFRDSPDLFDFLISPRPENAENVTSQAIAFMKNNPNKPFFLWMHFMDLHNVPAPGPDKRPEVLSSQEVDKYVSIYDEAIKNVDTQINFFLNELRGLKIDERTLIIVTSDHGEGINEHGQFFDHSQYVWDYLIRVPLIFYCPRLIPPKKIINCQVQLIDIAPTVCDILSIKKPDSFEGRSLFPFEGNAAACSAYAFSEHRETKGEEWIYTKISLRSFPWQLIYTQDKKGVTYGLFNLEQDPGEYNDVRGKEKSRFLFLKKELDTWMARKKPEASSAQRILDQETKEKLRSLGYLQ